MTPLARQRAATVAVWRADVATRPGGAWAQLDDVAVHTTGIDVPHWNGAFLTGSTTDWPRVRGWFAERGMPWGVLVPAELGIVPPTDLITTQRVMLRDLEHLAAVPALDWRWDAGDDAAAVQAEAFGDTLEHATAFVLPKLVNAACAVVVGYEDGSPVTTATLVAVSGVAAVYGVATVAAARGRGHGRAATLSVLHEGRRRGCDLSFLNPSDLGYGVYAGLGFRDAPGIGVYQPIL